VALEPKTGRRPVTAKSPRGTNPSSVLLGVPPASSSSWNRASLGLFLALAALLAFHEIIDLDLWLHLSAGRWMAAHHTVPREELWSFTAMGRPWVDLHWGYQVLVSAAHAVAGGFGIQLVHAAALLAALTLALRIRREGPPVALAWLYPALALLAAQERVLTRPEIFTGLFLMLTWHLSETIASGRRPSPGWLALPLVWTNMQGLFILGPILLGLRGFGFAIDGLARRARHGAERPGVVRWHLFAAGLMLAAALVNPYGIDGLALPFRLSQQISGSSVYSGVLGELLSPFEGQLTGELFVACLVLAAGAWALDRSRRAADLLPMVAFAALAFSARRNLLLFALVSMGPTMTSWSRIARAPRAFALRAPILRPIVVAIGVALLAWVGTGWHYRAVGSPKKTGFGFSRSEFPREAAAALAALAPSGNLFNSLGDGGFLIWSLPSWRVAMDGRAEVYGETIGRDVFRAYADPAVFAEFARKHDVSAIVMDTSTRAGCEFVRHVLDAGAFGLRFIDGRGAVLVRGANDAEPRVAGLGAPAESLSVPRARKAWGIPAPAPLEMARLARALSTVGLAAPAAHAYEAVVRATPGSADAFTDYGAALLAVGSFEEADRAFAEAHALEPDHDAAAAGHARVLERTGGPAAAVRYLAAFCAENPTAERAWTTLAAAQARGGDVASALRTLEAAHQRIPAIAVPWATLLAQTGDRARARDLLTTHLRRNPKDRRAAALLRGLLQEPTPAPRGSVP